MNVCKDPYAIVSASEEANRAFATLGLLRLVTDATPIDLICTYVIETNQSWGMRARMRQINEDAGSYWCYRSHMTTRENHNSDRIKMIPDGYVKMAKDYLIRSFWNQIDHLKGPACIRQSNFSSYCNRHRSRIYPKELLKTLSALYIPASGRLYDIRNAITSLHAVATPTMLDAANWIKPRNSCGCSSYDNSYLRRVDYDQFDTMRDEHERNISLLMTKLNSYCWDTTNRQSIPNEIEKNLLLDLIECFLIMFGPENFPENYINRQTYEYARLYDTMGGVAPKYEKNSLRCVGSYLTTLHSCGSRWEDGRLSIIEKLRYLSPEAAICMGNINNSWCSAAGMINPKLLETIHPQPINEVALFLKQELSVQDRKIEYTNRLLEAYKNGEYKPNTHEVCEDCAEDSSVPASVC